jgi:UDP-N-acetylmuramyl pentapeptide synthase
MMPFSQFFWQLCGKPSSFDKSYRWVILAIVETFVYSNVCKRWGGVMGATFTAEEILCATSSHLKSGYVDEVRGGLTWDIEEVKPGDWFIGVPSKFEDPHDNLNLALDMGARGVIVNRRSRFTSAAKDATIISVPDTKTAILDLLRCWRYRVQPKVVGVSGSCGRRVTIALLRQLLEGTHRTHVAFMSNLGWFSCMKDLLSMPDDTQVLIFEAGGIERGDVSRIGGCLDPDLAVLTRVQHPLPSAERNAFIASLYCELLETLPSRSGDRISAIIYDDNPAVQSRAESLSGSLQVRRRSLSGAGMTQRLSEQSVQELSAAMESIFSQGMTRAEIWCAVEAAMALGLSKEVLEEIFELEEGSEAESKKLCI